MGTGRTLWHHLFATLLVERAPPGFEVRAEVQLSPEPQRADLLLVRRPVRRGAGEARVLRALWPRIRREALVELKTVSRPVRRGELSRLLGYCAQYFAAQGARLARPESLLLVLVVPEVTRTLGKELVRMRWTRGPTDGGYSELHGCGFPGLLIVLDEVAAAERDDLLAVFGCRTVPGRDGRMWLEQQVASPDEETSVQQLEGYDEVLDKILSGLAPEKRLAGLAPEERLALLPAMPIEVLAGLTDAFVAALPPEVRTAVLEKLGKPR